MKAEEVAQECICMWELPRPEIWRCELCRKYRKGTEQFVSVTTVIKKNLPTDYSGVDPITLECARLRGIYVDQYFTEWLIDDINVVNLKDVPAMVAPSFPRDGERHGKDTANRIDRLIDWWLAKNWKASSVHRIVYSEADGVAGETDFETNEYILDLKNVANLQPGYRLQVGAYLSLDGKHRCGGIVHVTKTHVQFVEYPSAEIQAQWRTCLDWYQVRQQLR